MLLLSLCLLNVTIVLCFLIYLKLTCGICKCSKHLVGKVVIVTGANTGIGYETARDLAERGARVLLACRSEERGAGACARIVAATGNLDVHFRPLDLASLRSVRAFTENILATEKRLDILINNAGILETKKEMTEDGLLMAMQTNHFGPFLLTCLLLPLLKSSAPSRIINVSSLAYRYGKIDFQNLNMEKESKETYNSFKVYCVSKLCNMLMTVELAERLKGTNITANCLHPGAVNTEISANIKSKVLRILRILKFLPLLFSKQPWEGAQTNIYLAVSPDVEHISGKYFSDCRLKNTNAMAQDKELARKLWDVSENLVKLK